MLDEEPACLMDPAQAVLLHASHCLASAALIASQQRLGG